MLRTVLPRARALALAAGVLLLAAPTVAEAQPAARVVNAESAPVRLDQVMAGWEMRATGVSRLTPSEREALEGWLNRYVGSLRGAAPVAGSAGYRAPVGPAPMDTIRPAPDAPPLAPAPAAAPAHRPTRIALSADPLPSALEIVAVYDGGDLVATEDGSLWETYLPDRPNAAAWTVGQFVNVRGTPLPRQQSGAAYDVVLSNGEARTAALARFAGRRPPETAVPESGAVGPR